MTSYLSSLTMIKTPDKIKLDPLIKVRNKIVKNLTEQKEMAQCLLNGERYVANHEHWVTNPETQIRELLLKQKNVKPWFYQHNEKYIFELRYLNKAIEIQPGKNAILASNLNEISPLIDLLIKALEAGELDHVIKGIKRI